MRSTDSQRAPRIAAQEQYEVAYFAKKHKLTLAQAKGLIKDDRAKSGEGRRRR